MGRWQVQLSAPPVEEKNSCRWKVHPTHLAFAFSGYLEEAVGMARLLLFNPGKEAGKQASSPSLIAFTDPNLLSQLHCTFKNSSFPLGQISVHFVQHPSPCSGQKLTQKPLPPPSFSRFWHSASHSFEIWQSVQTEPAEPEADFFTRSRMQPEQHTQAASPPHTLKLVFAFSQKIIEPQT